MLSTKRKRGCNYTLQEINTFVDLVQQYQDEVEDKRTGREFLAQKREAWEKICSAYNAVATSGIRTVEQLKVLYDNKKQQARKSLGENNVNITTIGNMTEECSQKKDFIKHQTELFFQNLAEEKLEMEGQWNRTSCGNWCSITENDQNVLATNNEQVTPVPTRCMKSKIQKRILNYKQLYFKQKCQNAYLQKRKILQDIRLRKKEHLMSVKEHELKLSILQKEHDKKI